MSHKQNSFIGGFRIGFNSFFGWNWSWPLATLWYDKEGIIIKATGFKFSFSYAEITRIEPYSGLFSKGIRIFHKRKRLKFVVFWTKRPKELIDTICCVAKVL